MENTDAKVYVMIDDLSRHALNELLDCNALSDENVPVLRIAVRKRYEDGELPAEDIIAAWNDDTWNDR